MTYFIMAMHYTWWRGDALPPLAPLPGLRCEPTTDVALLARLHDQAPEKIATRLADANTAYVAFFGDEPAGYGWSGANAIGVGDKFWPITPPNRGLWDFATLPAFRGRGMYPHLLQAILRREEHEAEKFWIGHRIDNIASQRGIEKAGFQLVSFAVLTPERQIRQVPRVQGERGYGEPQGKHFGFVEVANQDLAPFDFTHLSASDADPTP